MLREPVTTHCAERAVGIAGAGHIEELLGKPKRGCGGHEKRRADGSQYIPFGLQTDVREQSASETSQISMHIDICIDPI